MSTISETRILKHNLMNEYRKAMCEAKKKECDAIVDAIHLLQETRQPLTAAGISAELDGRLSPNEVAGNLIAIKDGNSRYGRRIGNLPGYHGKYVGQRIAVKDGLHRRVKMVQVDDYGNIIAGTTRMLCIKDANTYEIKENGV